jgi:hypothetical protein
VSRGLPEKIHFSRAHKKIIPKNLEESELNQQADGYFR